MLCFLSFSLFLSRSLSPSPPPCVSRARTLSLSFSLTLSFSLLRALSLLPILQYLSLSLSLNRSLSLYFSRTDAALSLTAACSTWESFSLFPFLAYSLARALLSLLLKDAVLTRTDANRARDSRGRGCGRSLAFYRSLARSISLNHLVLFLCSRCCTIAHSSLQHAGLSLSLYVSLSLGRAHSLFHSLTDAALSLTAAYSTQDSLSISLAFARPLACSFSL